MPATGLNRSGRAQTTSRGHCLPRTFSSASAAASRRFLCSSSWSSRSLRTLARHKKRVSECVRSLHTARHVSATCRSVSRRSASKRLFTASARAACSRARRSWACRSSVPSMRRVGMGTAKGRFCGAQFHHIAQSYHAIHGVGGLVCLVRMPATNPALRSAARCV